MDYVYIHSGLMYGLVFGHCLKVLKGNNLYVSSCSFSPPDWIAAQYCRDGWDEGGFDRDEKGFLFGFYFM